MRAVRENRDYGSAVRARYQKPRDLIGRSPLRGMSFPMILRPIDSNGDILPVDDYSYSGYSSTPGIKIIVVSYAGARVAFVVTVYPAAP